LSVQFWNKAKVETHLRLFVRNLKAEPVLIVQVLKAEPAVAVACKFSMECQQQWLKG